MRKVDALVVDKTGTLTEGKPKVVSVVASPDAGEPDLLRFAASLFAIGSVVESFGRGVVASAGADGLTMRQP